MVYTKIIQRYKGEGKCRWWDADIGVDNNDANAINKIKQSL